MNQRWLTNLAWLIFILIVLVSGVTAYINFQNLDPGLSNFERIGEMFWNLGQIVFGFIAALIIAHQPRNVIGWLLFTPAAMALFASPIEVYLASYGAQGPPPTLVNLLMAWFSGFSWLLLIFPLLYILLLFPTGRIPSPGWRWVLYSGILLAGIFVFIATSAPEFDAIESHSWVLTNPIGFLPAAWIEPLILLWQLGLALFALSCIAALLFRFRRAGTVERQQLKWLFYSSSIFVGFFALTLPTNLNENLIFSLLFGLMILSIPASIGIAILRYRLWDIDLIIRRTLVYGVLTFLLALVYFGAVVLLQQFFGALTGQEDSPLAVVLSTLAIAALFNPLRRRLQDFIDRRFYRQRYDAERMLVKFASQASYETDLESLSGMLTTALIDSMHPVSIKLQLKSSAGKINPPAAKSLD